MQRFFDLQLLTGTAGGASLSIVYGVTAVLSCLLLLAYCCFLPKKNSWFVLLLASVMVVNIGYLALSISQSLGEALLANRLAYLGSVFLPLAMLMIILNVSGLSYRKWLAPVLLGVAAVVFLIAASPGYLDIYYKEVTFEKIDGVTVLKKVYGPLHGIYMVYLLGYFAAMVTTIVYATLHDKLETTSYAVMLMVAVFVNICVWLAEQFMDNSFELLSVSYIISELFLLGLHLMKAEMERQKEALTRQLQEQLPKAEAAESVTVSREQLTLFAEGLERLTPKERDIYNCYTQGLSTAQIMEALDIKENTLKFHNKNLYGKLGVSSRKQLLTYYKQLDK